MRYFRFEETPAGVDLVVTGPWSAQARDAILLGEADGLDLNYARGFQEPNLEFIEGLPIRRLNLLARTIGDLTPVYSLSDTLRCLWVESDPHAMLRLDLLPRLEDLGAAWSQIQGSIGQADRLERLYTHSYSEHDLTPLIVVPRIARVVMKQYPQVRSLDGVEKLPRLDHLGIHLGSSQMRV